MLGSRMGLSPPLPLGPPRAYLVFAVGILLLAIRRAGAGKQCSRSYTVVQTCLSPFVVLS